MIFSESRYADVPQYQVTTPNGDVVTALSIRFIPETPAAHVHVFTDGDRLDLLSFTFYRNAEKFWLIADANAEMDPNDLLQPGRPLLIPPDRT
jgi:nucleoid-associated protein YgaU